MSNVSRRDFLKILGAGLATLVVPQVIQELEQPCETCRIVKGVDGTIYDFTVWDCELTPDQIAVDYGEGDYVVGYYTKYFGDDEWKYSLTSHIYDVPA